VPRLTLCTCATNVGSRVPRAKQIRHEVQICSGFFQGAGYDSVTGMPSARAAGNILVTIGGYTSAVAGLACTAAMQSISGASTCYMDTSQSMENAEPDNIEQ